LEQLVRQDLQVLPAHKVLLDLLAHKDHKALLVKTAEVLAFTIIW
jgi:hypothetical protein